MKHETFITLTSMKHNTFITLTTMNKLGY